MATNIHKNKDDHKSRKFNSVKIHNVYGPTICPKSFQPNYYFRVTSFSHIIQPNLQKLRNISNWRNARDKYHWCRRNCSLKVGQFICVLCVSELNVPTGQSIVTFFSEFPNFQSKASRQNPH